ncbi:hypothetical protein HY065_02590 [Candidatus Berkelbacteria bacterium]|nr:hypothetical protein [Candidatus Berkelbacteria bacterium]
MRWSSSVGYTIGVGLIITLGLFGWFYGFRTFTAPAGAVSLVALLPLALLAGVASFFSPCSFPLLPGYFAGYLAGGRAPRPRPMTVGLASALGVVSFLLILGLLVGILGQGFVGLFGTKASIVPIRRIVALVLLLLGIAHFTGWFAGLFHGVGRLVKLPGLRQPSFKASYWFGFGYTLAGLGCTGAILGGLTLLALTSGGVTLALLTFGLAALTMATLMVVLSLLVAGAQEVLITKFKATTPEIKRWGGVVLILVAGYLFLSTFGIGF